MSYQEADYLQLSGLQHFSFCRRQWALIHVEQQWQDNLRTVEGDILHERAHDETIRERSRNKITFRGLRISSSELGISGSCDVVEFIRGDHGARLAGEDGLWQPYPVEYKRGSSKLIDADRLQLCAQAMCLEEMLGCSISEGTLYYGETRRREVVELTEELRAKVTQILSEMHDYYRRGHTPKVKPGKHCNACSMKEVCLPVLYRMSSASDYIRSRIGEDGE